MRDVIKCSDGTTIVLGDDEQVQGGPIRGYNTPVVGLVVPTGTTRITWDDVLHSDAVVSAINNDEPQAAVAIGAKSVRLRSRGPGKGAKSDAVHLLTIAIQALQTAREQALLVRADMPKHERDRLLIPVLSDAGLAVRSTEEAIERWEAGKV